MLVVLQENSGMVLGMIHEEVYVQLVKENCSEYNIGNLALYLLTDA